MNLDANARRFSGFADLYDAVRPVPPAVLAEIITTYAGGRPELVVDLGSGTGLSTRWATSWSNEVVGVEPNVDMRLRASTVTSGANVRYLPGSSDATGLADGCADVVLAVQAMHWMEPTATLIEVGRLLRPGGVFAAIDCDWPPSLGDARAEQAWHTARAIVAVHERELAKAPTEPSRTPRRVPSSSPQSDDLRPTTSGDLSTAAVIADGVRYWHKGGHLGRMAESGQFKHCVEIAALAVERGDADRFVQLFRSQGDYQAVQRHGLGDETLGVEAFAGEVHATLGPAQRPFWFTYRARIGVR